MATVSPNRFRYQYVPPSSVAVILGLNAAAGDYLHRLVMLNDAVGTASVTLIDGATIIPIQIGAAQLQRGPQALELGIVSRNGPWAITTGAGCGVIAVGVTVG